MLLNVKYNDISVIYVTAHRFAGGLKKKFDLVQFLVFYNVPIQAPTRGYPFYMVNQRHATFSRLFSTRWGYGGHIVDLTPGPYGGRSLIIQPKIPITIVMN